jgi:hypothetical protein
MSVLAQRLAACLVAAAAFVAATPADAVEEQLLEKARALVVEARPFVEKANDVELEMEQRRVPRKEAFKRLKDARALYDKYLDTPGNESMEEKLDKEYVEMMVLLHGIKKDSALGELEKDSETTELPRAEGAAPTKPPAEPGTGDAPPPPVAPTAPAAPPTDAGAAKRQLKAITDYEKDHPGDLPLLERFYTKFMADFPDVTTPEYAAAAERLGKIKDRIKSVFQSVAKRDYDTLSGGETKDERTIFGKLSQDFNSKEPDVRRRAASLMAASRCRSAAYFLARGLTDKDEILATICREGLIGIGGTYVGENLVKLYRDAAKPKQDAALEVLSEVTKKSQVDAVAVSHWIGRFVLSNESDVAEASIALLVRMGKAGGPGLMNGLDSKIPLKKVETMKALADIRYYRAATTIADRYLAPKTPPALRQAAIDALKTMGKPAVPHLISQLAGSSGQWTAWVVREITGDKSITIGDEKGARAWCNAHPDEIKDE